MSGVSPPQRPMLVPGRRAVAAAGVDTATATRRRTAGPVAMEVGHVLPDVDHTTDVYRGKFESSSWTPIPWCPSRGVSDGLRSPRIRIPVGR